MGRWLRHRPGGVGLRSERPGITGAMGPSVSRDPWTRPVARAAVGTQECTQIGENSLSAQPPLACGVRPLVTSRWRRWCRMRFSVTSRWRRPHRIRFSVTSPAQNALFRRVRFSSPAQTWSHLTQRRILRRRSHVKAQSAPVTSRKGALCTPDLTEKRTLWPAHTQNALFRESDTPRMRLSVSCRLQSGAFAYTVATRFAEASTHTNPRRALKGQHWSIRER